MLELSSLPVILSILAFPFLATSQSFVESCDFESSSSVLLFAISENFSRSIATYGAAGPTEMLVQMATKSLKPPSSQADANMEWLASECAAKVVEAKSSKTRVS